MKGRRVSLRVQRIRTMRPQTLRWMVISWMLDRVGPGIGGHPNHCPRLSPGMQPWILEKVLNQWVLHLHPHHPHRYQHQHLTRSLPSVTESSIVMTLCPHLSLTTVRARLDMDSPIQRSPTRTCPRPPVSEVSPTTRTTLET